MHWKKALMVTGIIVGATFFMLQLVSLYGKLHYRVLVLAAPVYLFIALLLSLIQYFIQVFIWSKVLNYFGITLVPRKLFEGYFLSFLPRYVPGSVWGYLSRSQWFRQNCGVAYELSIYASVMEQWAFIVTAGLLASLYAYLHFNNKVALLLAIICLIMIVITGPSFIRMMNWLRRLIPMKGSLVDMRVYSKNWLLTCVLDVAFWFTYGGAIFSTYAALTDAGISFGSYMASVFSAVLSWLLGFVVLIVPAGLGIREWSMSQFLALTLGTESWQAELVPILARFMIIIAELIFLMIGVSLNMATMSNMKHDSPE